MTVAIDVSNLEVTVSELRLENQSLHSSVAMLESENRVLLTELDRARAERDALLTRHAEAMTILRQTCAGLVEGLRRADETEKRRTELTVTSSGTALSPINFVGENK